MKNNKIWELNENGEIMYPDLQRDVKRKYKSDTIFDNSIVPYLFMIICATIDGVVFYALFSKISFDSPVMLGVQIAGFLFGFDVVPIFIGIQYRRVRQGLTKDKIILRMALVVCAIACAMNIALRVMTIGEISPDPSGTAISYTGITSEEVSKTDGIDLNAAAMTVVGIGIPIVTSLGSFFISYLTYNPLMIRKRREEAMIVDKRDEVRRFEAILEEYAVDEEFENRLLEEDDGKFQEMQKMHRAIVAGNCDYVRERLKEHLGSPTANNVLSEEICADILKRLDRELAALDSINVTVD